MFFYFAYSLCQEMMQDGHDSWLMNYDNMCIKSWLLSIYLHTICITSLEADIDEYLIVFI